ncbi:uncharacterized protein [Apostichopus japonicus]|uniref:uncharacterized protein n=1 Tax=Stichopus japonicus TaxID=307972 RepID=UPI003AB5CC79
MATSFKYVEETAKKKNSTGFGRFKAKLADILTEENILQLATFFQYPPAKIDFLQSKNSRNHLMIRYMEERGQITERDITTLLRALKVLNLHGTQKRVQTMFELHTGKRCTGDDQSIQEPEDHNFGKLERRLNGSLTSDVSKLTYLARYKCCTAYVDSIILNIFEAARTRPSLYFDNLSYYF